MKKLFVLISLFLTFSLSTFTPAFAEDSKTEAAKVESSEDKATEAKEATGDKETEAAKGKEDSAAADKKGKKGSGDEEPECE